MKLNSLLSVKEDASAIQQEHALMSSLKSAVREIKKDIDYDFGDGTMDYVRDLFVNDKKGLFKDRGRCLADASEILDHVEHEKIVLLVSGYDGNWEEAYIVQKDAELTIKKSAQPGRYVFIFRGMKADFSKKEAEDFLAQFCDTEIIEYERIGDRIERSWDDGFDEDTPRYVWRAAQNRHYNRDPFEPELTEDDYKFEKESLYGAFIYKDLCHH